MMTQRLRWLLACATLFVGQKAFTTNLVVYGNDVPPRLQARLTELLSKTGTTRTVDSASEAVAGDYVLAIGDVPLVHEHISESELLNRGPEGFIVRSFQANGVTILVADGNSQKAERLKFNRGVMYAAYEVLQQLGFRFNHPMDPKAPKALSLAHPVEVSESPRWPVRGLHIHTQHQIELTHVLNGWGINGPSDVKSFDVLLKDWDLFCEWMIAHRQNVVEWMLLENKETPEFNDSQVRLNRLTRIVEMSHAWGLVTGLDVGIVFEQQNAWRLLRSSKKTPAQEEAEIRGRVDWVFKADFDLLDVESGFQEFRAPDDLRALAWMNVVTAEASKLGRKAQSKVHVSKDQAAKHFKDPETGAPLNFNFLPHYADKRLTVLPHTVQVYGLQDPAPVYGNKDFSEIRRFIAMEAGERDVVYYPEAAYWCSYDIDVPLFLATYGERRLRDLRLIASDEDAGLLGRGENKGSHIQGQILFSSGFEWGYWLNNLIAMHAAWNPRLDVASDEKAYEAVLRDVLREESPLIPILAEQVRAEDDLLIHGRVDGKEPRQIDHLTGIAYLAGQETWDELNTWIAKKFKKEAVLTQASRAGFVFRDKLVVDKIDYVKDVAPLLAEMASRFDRVASEFESLQSPSEEATEIAQASRMMALRSEQLMALYQAHAQKPLRKSKEWKSERLQEARRAVDRAEVIMRAREKKYRVDLRLIQGWGHSPTSYGYGYLWTAHSLMWWYRDEGSAQKLRKNFCYMNIVNPADNVFANGQKTFIYKALKVVSAFPLFGALNDCLSPSKIEPNPRQRLRGKAAEVGLQDVSAR
jgi:hypothetical protein